jgi:ribonuclease D
MNTKNEIKYTYVDNAETLARLTEALGGTTRVGLDTEADSLHHYFEKVCLIQLSFSGRNYIVDPLADISLTAFLEALSGKELIIQGADYDLRMLKKTFGFLPKAPVFDTMLAAQVLGYEKIGLGALTEKCCGVELTHAGQKSDWSKRPLSQGQLHYASDDTRFLEKIADTQAAELRALGRDEWHRECCERVVRTTGLTEIADDKEAWRIKGSSKLAPRELAFLRELWKWRDEAAQKRDRPPFMILHNEDLVALAVGRAANAQAPALSFLKRVTGESLERLENAVRTAESMSPSEWPVPPVKARFQGMGPSQEKVDALLAACRTIASGLKIEPCFLASRAAVTSIVRHQARSVETVREAGGMLRWQAELVMPAVKTVLKDAEK